MAMAEDSPELPDFTHTTAIYFKDRTGGVRELHIKQPMEPGQKVFTFADLQLLAREISKCLKEEML
jgi:hypothetical protein